MSKTKSKSKSKKEIEARAEYWYNRIGEALDYLCHNIVVEIEPCYSTYIDMDILEIAQQLTGSSYPWLSDKEIKELESEDPRVLELVNKALQKELNRLSLLSEFFGD